MIREYERRERDDDDFWVHPDNWDAVRLFQASRTQWRYAGMAGVRVGLDYSAVQVVAGAKGIKMAAETFEGLQILEAESLRIFSE